MSDNYVLEWSQSQNAFHIQEAKISVEKNLNSMIDDRPSDYIPLCIATRAECEKQADRFRHYLAKR